MNHDLKVLEKIKKKGGGGYFNGTKLGEFYFILFYFEDLGLLGLGLDKTRDFFKPQGGCFAFLKLLCKNELREFQRNYLYFPQNTRQEK